MTMLEIEYPAHIVDLFTKNAVDLFEMVMREALDGFECGLQMGGRRVIDLWKQNPKVKVGLTGTISGEFQVRRGVRQGCILSPSLFNILAEMVMHEALDGFECGLQMGGRRVTNLRYTDDIILFSLLSNGTANTSGQTRQCMSKVRAADKPR